MNHDEALVAIRSKVSHGAKDGGESNTVPTVHPAVTTEHTTQWELCDYVDEKGSYEIYEGRGPGRLVCEILNCAPDDAEKIVNDRNAHDDLVAALKAAHAFVKGQCDEFDAGDLTRGDFCLLEMLENALAKAKAGAQ
jgi:hypothetical protein